jgi:hypothetical protein
MHPDLLGALARQRMRELLEPAEFRDTRNPRRLRLEPRDAVRRARRLLGSVLLDLGVHLLAAT